MGDSRKQTAAELFLQDYDFIRGFAFRCAPNRKLVDEIVNDVFIAFMSGYTQWDLDQGIRPILVHLIRTTAATHWREYYRHAPERLREIAELLQKTARERLDAANSDEEEFNHDLLQLRRCIEKLSEKTRTILEMHYWKNIPLIRIADAFNVKASAVRQSVVRIRAKLRQCVETARKQSDERD